MLLVHRPKYDDWSFPKGKQDPGEHVTATAVREVLEETGLRVRLGRPLPPQRYRVSGDRRKTVHYWVAHAIGDDDVSSRVADDEIDEARWFRRDEAARRLTYHDDRDLLEQLDRDERKTRALVVLRHARARSRGAWDAPDVRRPLTPSGERQAQALIPVLAAYGVRHVVTSDAVRCHDTVAPYAAGRGLQVEDVAALSEEQATPEDVRAVVADLLGRKRATVVCTHRPVLPWVLDTLGLQVEEPLAKGELLVVHHRQGRVRATERHRPA